MKKDLPTPHVAPRQRSKRSRADRHGDKAIPEPQTGSETGRAPQHPEDRARDDRLEAELRENAGESPLDRHRANLTGIENEEDGIPDDAEDFDAEQELADQRLRDVDNET